MIVGLGVAVALAAVGAGGLEAGHVDASLEFDGEILDQRFLDIDGDGRDSLCVALRRRDGRRELRILEPRRHGFDSKPEHVVSVLEDVLAYAFAEVREEAGRELVFLTRSGAYSYSLTREGYRGNIARLLEEELLYDVPDSRSLPYWPYVLPREGGDLLLLPGRSDFAVWGPRRDASGQSTGEVAPPYEAWMRIGGARPRRETAEDDDGGVTVSGSGDYVLALGGDSDDIFLRDSGRAASLLSDGKSFPAPAQVDLDGDGRLDLVLRKGDEFWIYLHGPDGFAPEPSRVEPLPEYIADRDDDHSFWFADLNGDAWLDLVVRSAGDVEGIENAQVRVLVLLGSSGRLLPEEPAQVLRFEAANLRVDVVDVNGDGRADLSMRKFTVPSVIETVSGIEFELTYLAYFATGKDSLPFERKAALNQSQTFDLDSLGDAIKSRHLKLDCDGDGLPDLVEVDLRGRIVVRRLRHESGFFTGESWELDESPWRRFDVLGAIQSLEVLDVNDDGLADIVSPGEDSLTLLISNDPD